MRKLAIIGVGTGSPEHVTVQAIEAMNRSDVFFVADKGGEKSELAELREALCRRFIREPRYRIARFADPERAAGGAYRAAVSAWHAERERIYERLLFEELADGARAVLRQAFGHVIEGGRERGDLVGAVDADRRVEVLRQLDPLHQRVDRAGF